jgi:hypothetical protein
VQIGDEAQALADLLELHELTDGTEIVAEMKLARGLDAGKDAHTKDSECVVTAWAYYTRRSKCAP